MNIYRVTGSTDICISEKDLSAKQTVFTAGSMDGTYPDRKYRFLETRNDEGKSLTNYLKEKYGLYIVIHSE